jgi:resuscitation-promoting factor RpfA
LIRVASWGRLLAAYRAELAEARRVAAAARAAIAAPISVDWDAIRACECPSGWHCEDGIGPDVTGGLQISTETWLANGGGEYAPRALYATREEQIAVAERILATQGIGAWPYCGRFG